MLSAFTNLVAKRLANRSGSAGVGRDRHRGLLLPQFLFVLVALLLSDVRAQEDGLAIPYSAVFQPTNAFYENPLRGQVWGVDPQLKMGGGTLDVAGVGTSAGIGLDMPLRLMAPPEDATFRFGRLYLDIPRSYLEMIASDNADQEKHATERGVIAMVATDFDLFLELFEGAFLTAGGRFVYLPFEGEAGFQGRGFLEDSMSASGELNLYESLFLAARYDGQVGDWSFFATDRIAVQSSSTDAMGSSRSQELRLRYLQDGQFDKADELGRYSLGGGSHANEDEGDDTFESQSARGSRWEVNNDGYLNDFAFGVYRMLPTDTMFSAAVFRYDRWGMEEGADGNGSEWEQGINLALRNQRYNMRFKPYLSYTATEGSVSRYWEHVMRVGAAGPITQYTFFDGNVGYAWRSVSGRRGGSVEDVLWHVSLINELNALTTQRLSYSRSVSEPDSEIHTTLSYDIRHTFGPRLEGGVFASWTEEEEGNVGRGGSDGHDETQYEAGGILTWDVSSRLTLRLLAALVAVQEEETDDDFEETRIQLSADYDITDTLSLWLSYEHVFRDDEQPDESYRENLVRLRLTKTW